MDLLVLLSLLIFSITVQSLMINTNESVPEIHNNLIHSALSYNPLKEWVIPDWSSSRKNALKNKQILTKNQFSSKNPLNSKNGARHVPKDFLTIQELPDDFTGNVLTQRLPFSPQPSKQQVLVTAGTMRRISISTIVAGTLFYSLTILPLIMLLTNTGPFAGFQQPYGQPFPPPFIPMFGKRRRRRSLPKNWQRQFLQMPLLDQISSMRFLSLFENTLQVRRVTDPICSRFFMCKVYREVITLSRPSPPNMHQFEEALLNIFGVVSEQSKSRVNMASQVALFHESALIGISGQDCSLYYTCSYDWDLQFVPNYY